MPSVAALLLLAACNTSSTTGPFDPAVATPVASIINPCDAIPVASYTRAQQRAAAAELAGLGDTSMLATMMGDYGTMRSAVRACHTPAKE